MHATVGGVVRSAAPFVPDGGSDPVPGSPTVTGELEADPVPVPAAAPERVGARPMWILGLVIMVDQIDQNIVRGVVPQLKEYFNIDDAAIGLLLSAFVL